MDSNSSVIKLTNNSNDSDDAASVVGQKCSWTELKMIVNDLRREIATILLLQPMQISFKKMANGKMRIYYLVNSPDWWGIPLLYVDVPSSSERTFTRLVGHFLFNSLPETSSRRSREQQLLSERQRTSTCGLITTYQLHSACPTLIFPMSDGLYIIDNIEDESMPLEPLPLETRNGSFLAPVMSPKSPWLIAYAACGDLWLTSRRLKKTGCPFRLTYACRGLSRLADDPMQAGIPSYVMQEEFSRYTGFWWQPKSDDDVYRIVYEEVDESNVDILSFPSHNRYNGDTEEFRFPRAGTSNAHSVLRMVEFKVQSKKPNDHFAYSNEHDNKDDISDDAEEMITDVKYFDLYIPLDEEFPWMEYIPRVGWTPCGQYVWCQIMDRRQQRLELILIPVTEFCIPFRYEADTTIFEFGLNYTSPPSPPGVRMQLLLSEQNPDTWINIHDILHFLPMDDPTEIRFIWASEVSGHLHLYLVSAPIIGPYYLKEASPSTSKIFSNMDSKCALTKGDWEVIGRRIWVDERNGLIYFLGLKETPLERHLYYVSYQNEIRGLPKLLTERGFSHTVDIDEKCKILVITRSNLYTQPICQVFRLMNNITNGMNNVTLIPYGPLLHPAEVSNPTFNWPDWNEQVDSPWAVWKPLATKIRNFDSRYTPELYSTRLCEGTGEEIHAMVFRPTGKDRDKPCPTILHVYGGPVVQTVSNTFKGMRQLRMHMMAARGYCVVCIDSRGSKHRGLKFESHLRCKMGTVEIKDQVEVLTWLADQLGCIDLNRVAVHGWSYGGYLSLMALVQYPELFKLCIACAPVTSWHLYDTAYTERYMDLPNINPTGYARGSVLRYADHFPEQENRLLIVHGLQDENVHFLHTQQLIEALVRAGKPYRLQVYPGERHSLRHPEASAHYEATLLAFLQNYL